MVTDKVGKPILNLNKSNFVVYEDGKVQVADGLLGDECTV